MHRCSGNTAEEQVACPKQQGRLPRRWKPPACQRRSQQLVVNSQTQESSSTFSASLTWSVEATTQSSVISRWNNRVSVVLQQGGASQHPSYATSRCIFAQSTPGLLYSSRSSLEPRHHQSPLRGIDGPLLLRIILQHPDPISLATSLLWFRTLPTPFLSPTLCPQLDGCPAWSIT